MSTFEWIIVLSLAAALLWKMAVFIIRVRWTIQKEREEQLKARGIAKVLDVPTVTIRRELSTCAICRRPHPFKPSPNIPADSVRCDGCWEVEHRLADYLRDGGEKANAFVMHELFGKKKLRDA